MATWIAASIRIMGTKARSPDVVQRHLIISRGTRPVTAKATWSKLQATLEAKNTRYPDSAVVVDAAKGRTVEFRRVNSICEWAVALARRQHDL
jgi:hypothetical protein